jgi:hypothetical protein
VEPVFVKNSSGKISPHRLIWPSYWAQSEGENLRPLHPDDVAKTAGRILTVEEDASEVLKALALYGEIQGVPVLVLGGKVYRPNVDGLLDVAAYPWEEMAPEFLWGVQTREGILPLIPEFDPDAEAPDIDAETRIQNVLMALATIDKAPAKPAVVYKKALYHMPEGYLEKSPWTGESAPNAALVWWDGEKSEPMVSGFQVRSITASVGSEQTLTEEQVVLVLQALSHNDAEDSFYFYVCGGRVFELDETGNLTDSRHPAAEPVVWPLGHRVRPAQQSLGINGCMDCHSESSDFFFGIIRGNGPLKTDKYESRSAHSFMNLDKPYQKLFGFSFRVRPLLKVLLFVVAVIVGSMLLILMMVILGRYTGLIEKRR